MTPKGDTGLRLTTLCAATLGMQDARVLRSFVAHARAIKLYITTAFQGRAGYASNPLWV